MSPRLFASLSVKYQRIVLGRALKTNQAEGTLLCHSVMRAYPEKGNILCFLTKGKIRLSHIVIHNRSQWGGIIGLLWQKAKRHENVKY